jgi:hypothetical protein
MVESLQYQIYLGDAWTNRSRIRMIPLPVIEPQFEVAPPAYAAGVETVASYVGASSFTVLAASRVQLRVRSVNSRPLDSVTLRILGQRDITQHDLVPLSESRTAWGLPADTNVWRSVTEQQQYELIVKDAEGLRPREPVIGQIRVRPDQPPSAQLNTVHQVVLPAARPTLALTADDDYLIARLRLRIEIERFALPDETVQSADEELFHVDVAADRWPLKARSLPLDTTYSLDMSQWNLSKGDQLKLTLEAADGRGSSPGAVTPSEPLYLEVSDQTGVLAAIAEADEEAERRLDEMIQQQLDAGEGG